MIAHIRILDGVTLNSSTDGRAIMYENFIPDRVVLGYHSIQLSVLGGGQITLQYSICHTNDFPAIGSDPNLQTVATGITSSDSGKIYNIDPITTKWIKIYLTETAGTDTVVSATLQVS